MNKKTLKIKKTFWDQNLKKRYNRDKYRLIWTF